MQSSTRHKIFLPLVLGLLTLLLSFAPSTAKAQTIYSTNFENFTSTNYQGWTSDDDSAIWVVGTPTVGPDAAFQGTKCATTGLAGNYPTNEDSRFISPKITLPSLALGNSITLQFDQWCQFSGGGGEFPSQTFGDVEIAVWNGAIRGSWTQVSRQIYANSGWSNFGVDLSAYAGQTISIGLHFNAGNGTADGWFIDNVLVSTVPDWAFGQTATFENFTATNQQGWSADNGVWQVGSPTAGPDAAFQGTQCATTGLGGNYPTNQDTRLVSPPVTLPTAPTGQSLVLGFDQWFQFSGGGGEFPSQTTGDIEVSVWNPGNPNANPPVAPSWGAWTQVSRQIDANSGWSYSGVDLTAYAGDRIQVGFHFNAGNGSASGWFVDNVSLTSVSDWAFGQTAAFENFTATNQQGWSADNGVWQVGTPKAGPDAAFQGTQCATTGLGGNYPTNQDTRLVSPPVTLPTAPTGQSLVLGFDQWFQFSGGGGEFPSQTTGDIEVSVWNPGNPNANPPVAPSWGAWTQVSRQIDANSGWSYSGVDLTAYAGDRIQVGFHFNAGNGSASGWFVDNVSLTSVSDWVVNQTATFENFTATNQQGWSADNGVWQVGSPTAGPNAAFQGTQCATTGLGGNYPTNQDTRLVSPPFTLPTLASGQSAVLAFPQWFQFSGGAGEFPSQTTGDIEVSVWNPGNPNANPPVAPSWGPWSSALATYTGSTNGWESGSPIDLSAYSGDRIIVGFHFNAGNGSAAGWFIDNVIVAVSPNIVSFSPASGLAGTKVTLTGSGFTGATSVQFNGTSAAFTVVSDSQITATVPKGATTGLITVTTPNGTTTSSQNFLVLGLSSLSLSPTTVAGGTSSTGTVVLTAVAPTDEVVTLASQYPTSVGVPASVTVLAGQTSATFNITTKLYSATYTNYVQASYSGTVESAKLTVLGNPLTLTLNPATVTGGNPSTGTVTLPVAATGNVVVTLGSQYATSVVIPASVTILAGQSSATFPITTRLYSETYTNNIDATYSGATQSAKLTVLGDTIASLTLSPATVLGGTNSTGTVTLTQPAPSGGLTVTLGSQYPTSVGVPASITIPAGKTSATFTVTTKHYSSGYTNYIEASNAVNNVSAKLTVTS